MFKLCFIWNGRKCLKGFENTLKQINACNGRHCGDTFPGPNKDNKPSMWTENWTTQWVFTIIKNVETWDSFMKVTRPLPFILKKYLTGSVCLVMRQLKDQ